MPPGGAPPHAHAAENPIDDGPAEDSRTTGGTCRAFFNCNRLQPRRAKVRTVWAKQLAGGLWLLAPRHHRVQRITARLSAPQGTHSVRGWGAAMDTQAGLQEHSQFSSIRSQRHLRYAALDTRAGLSNKPFSSTGAVAAMQACCRCPQGLQQWHAALKAAPAVQPNTQGAAARTEEPRPRRVLRCPCLSRGQRAMDEPAAQARPKDHAASSGSLAGNSQPAEMTC
jgi:hypothetical protein